MQRAFVKTFNSTNLTQMASYKLSYTLVKHHKPLSFGEAIAEWAQSCDVESKVFKGMPRSRQTLTRRVTKIADVIQKENIRNIKSSPCWGIQMDESTDKGGFAQAIIYCRYVDMQACHIATRFLAILRIEGSPNAENLFQTFDQFVETEHLPKEKLVSFSSDGASVMRSEGRGVSGHLRRNYNQDIFLQHCIVHRQVLGAKSGLERLPSNVHSTVDAVMNHFKNSHVRKEKLTAIIEMSDNEHEYQQLVAYHRVRWLSLNDCVQRFTDLLPEIVSYFELQAHTTSIRLSERAKLQELYDGLVDPAFQLYLYFLRGRLPILASINTQLQKKDQDLFTSYQKIDGFKKTFLEPILHEVDDGMQEGNVRTESDVDNIDYDCKEFIKFKEQAISSGQLSFGQLHEVMNNIFNFTAAIGRSLDARFPELDFVIKNLSFLCPANRKHSRCDIEAVVRRYCKNSVAAAVANRQYSVYRNDDSVDYVYLHCEKQPDTFFCRLAQMPEYDQFGLLAITLMCMSPDTVECERGFSCMNLTKDKCATRLSGDNLQSRLAVFLDPRTLSSFPFEDIVDSV